MIGVLIRSVLLCLSTLSHIMAAQGDIYSQRLLCEQYDRLNAFVRVKK